MANVEVPSDDEVVAALQALSGNTTALRLCESLIQNGHPRLQSQLAIQRAAERGKIYVWSDWSLHLEREQAREVVAA